MDELIVNNKINQRTNINWTPYLATAYAEGFCEGEAATAEEELEAWAYLISTKVAYSLQGWFGRVANKLIENGLINTDGSINWNQYDSQ